MRILGVVLTNWHDVDLASCARAVGLAVQSPDRNSLVVQRSEGEGPTRSLQGRYHDGIFKQLVQRVSQNLYRWPSG